MSTCFLVTGPPCSGKTTWSRKTAEGMHNPVILDLDTIRQDLGSRVEHGHGLWLLKPALAVRAAALLEWRKGHTGPLFYITCSPSADDWKNLPPIVKHVPMMASRELCRERAIRDKRPPSTLNLIDRWFRNNPQQRA